MAAVIGALTTLWAIWCADALRTHGVTGSDPYAYVQMGVDLAERGTLAHAFPLVEHTFALGIDSHPVTHVGYRIPTDARRIAPTVWPIGFAWFTALAWRLGGETATYYLAPLFGLASLALTYVLTRQLTRDALPEATARAAAGAFAVLITATSLQQITWQTIPMADTAAQCLSLLALVFALAGRPMRSGARAICAGLALGMAFNVRYTQVLIAPSLALTLWLFGETRARTPRARDIALCAAAAFVAVLPTFAYHATWFGGPFTTGSDELANFSLVRAPRTAYEALAALLDRREFGLIGPLLLAGGAALVRGGRKHVLAVVIAYAGAVLGFHMFYDYLRIRDVLSIFPVLAALAGIGIVAAWRWAATRSAATRACVLVTLSAVLTLRAMETLALPVTRGFGVFGHVQREQRNALRSIGEATAPNAVIGGALNSGAIDLHARRRSFRPGAWSPNDFARFIEALHATNTPVYLLLDGDELASVEQTAYQRFTVDVMGSYALPYYEATGGGSTSRDVRLLRLSPRSPVTSSPRQTR
jgi:hypothetical protein